MVEAAMTVHKNLRQKGFLFLLCFLLFHVFAAKCVLAENNLSLTAVPTSLNADGYTPSLITAIADTNGVVESGVQLTFNTNLGSFSSGGTSITTYTGNDGKAVVALTSSTAGIATVTCDSAGGIHRVVNVNFTSVPQPSPTPNPSVLSSIVLSVTNSPVAVTDVMNTTPKITAQLYDQYGKTLTVPGVSVVFTTTPSGFGYFSNNLQTITISTDAAGQAAALLYAKRSGTASVYAQVGSITSNPVYVNFTDTGQPAYISLTASPNWIPADGSSYSAITAVILDSSALPVAAGTAVSFSTTLGVFGNGKATFSTVTTDDTGKVTAYLRSSSSLTTGTAVITCVSGSAMQTLTVGMVRTEYETEPNDDMSHANAICFDNVFIAQLSSPYDEDWYTFTLTTSSRISINFITTAIPIIAGKCTDSTTVGTYKVEIRGGDINAPALMTYQNVDCTYDNGLWQTGVKSPGTYYVRVFCPRNPDASHYLSSYYKLAVFNDYYVPCSKTVNAASLSQASSTYELNVPVIDTSPYLWANLQWDPVMDTGLMFRLADYGVVSTLSGNQTCNISNLNQVNGNYVLHIPTVTYGSQSYQVDMTYVPTADGTVWFLLSDIQPN